MPPHVLLVFNSVITGLKIRMVLIQEVKSRVGYLGKIVFFTDCGFLFEIEESTDGAENVLKFDLRVHSMKKIYYLHYLLFRKNGI